MAQRKTQRRIGERHAMGSADGVDARDTRHDIRRRGTIIVARAVHRPGREDAGIEHAAQDDADPLAQRQRQEALRSALFQQRIASGHQHRVEIAGLGEARADLRLVDADADRLDHALAAQPV